MKQSITHEQFGGLSEQDKEKYLNWYSAKEKETGQNLVSYRIVGTFIWFLDEHLKGWWKIERSSTKDAWRIQAEHNTFNDEGQPELCDALWEAVKTILESEEPQS